MTQKEAKEPKCIDVEIALMEHFDYRKNLMVPNIVSGRILQFETDMLMVSDSGYAHGFEIKVSKSDLRADFNKPQSKHSFYLDYEGFMRYYGKFKHFSYVIPESLEKWVLFYLPDCFGVYSCYYNGNGFSLRCVRKPEKLSSYKWSCAEMLKIAKLGSMRIYKQRIKQRQEPTNDT